MQPSIGNDITTTTAFGCYVNDSPYWMFIAHGINLINIDNLELNIQFDDEPSFTKVMELHDEKTITYTPTDFKQKTTDLSVYEKITASFMYEDDYYVYTFDIKGLDKQLPRSYRGYKVDS